MAAPAQARTSSPESAWLFGPGVDLLVGAGVGYLLTFPILLWVASATGVAGWPILVVAAISFFINAPHYGATLLRVYEQREDRQRYALFAIYLTLFLALAFVAGVYDLFIGSLLITLYITTSPWHIGGQNYGIALMFLRRRGVTIEPRAKRLFYASFVLAFVLAFLSTHVADSNVVYAAGASTGGNEYSVLRLGLPTGIVGVVAPIVFVVYLGCAIGSLWLFARQARPRDVVPAVSLVLAQALWFVVPTLLFFTDRYSSNLLPFAAIWISAAHSAQYLWITTYYAKRADPQTKAPGYLGRTLLAGSFITIVPGLLFVPAFLGGVSWHAGLSVLLFAVANLHHFMLDGAVWKLRDGRVSRALLRTEPDATPIGPERPSPWWRLVWVTGALALFVGVYEFAERRLSLQDVTTRDLASARAALDRLGWVGRDSAEDHVVLGDGYASVGDFASAERQYRRSLDLQPTAEAWLGLGRLQMASGDPAAARAAFLEVLEDDPGNLPARRGLVRIFESEGRHAEAVMLLEEALTHIRGERRAIVLNEIARLRSAAADAPSKPGKPSDETS